jgi:uncharacterized membrane protein YhaH (DUF805 family)
MRPFLYTLFSTRINRATYAAGVFISVAFFLALYTYIFPSFQTDTASHALLELLLVFISIVVECVFFASLYVRRWHDCTGEDWMTFSRFNRGGHFALNIHLHSRPGTS